MSTWFARACANLNVALPRVFVETGTYRGDGVAQNRPDFQRVHSIELKKEFVDAARARFAQDKGVTVHHGDSAEVLAVLAPAIDEPALFYLDAHFSGGETAFGQEADKGCPVLRELAALSARKQPGDVIVVDDMRLMGKAAYGGTPGDAVYPLTFFDFTHATKEAMLEALARPCRAVMAGDVDRMVIVCT